MHHQAYGCICYQRVGMSCFIKGSSVMVTFRSPRPRPSEMCLRSKENDSLSPPVTKHRKCQHEVVWWDRNLTHIQTRLSCHTVFFLLFLVALALQGKNLSDEYKKTEVDLQSPVSPLLPLPAKEILCLVTNGRGVTVRGWSSLLPPPPQTSPMIRSAPLPRPR